MTARKASSFGGSCGALTASAGTKRSARRRRAARGAVAVAGLGLAYHRFGRPRMLRWGISEAEAQQPLPGDELVPDPLAGDNTTHAVVIDAPAAAVWPWIVQIGHTRGGWYTHEWVERLFGVRYAEGHSATRIHPEFQHLEVGDKSPTRPLTRCRCGRWSHSDTC